MSPLFLVVLVIPLTYSVTLVKEQQLSVKVLMDTYCISIMIVSYTLSYLQILTLLYNLHVKMEILD